MFNLYNYTLVVTLFPCLSIFLHTESSKQKNFSNGNYINTPYNAINKHIASINLCAFSISKKKEAKKCSNKKHNSNKYINSKIQAMESSKKNIQKSECPISNTKIYYGDSDELICVKVYKGDWGHWDEKPEKTESIPDEDIEDSTEKV